MGIRRIEATVTANVRSEDSFIHFKLELPEGHTNLVYESVAPVDADVYPRVSGQQVGEGDYWTGVQCAEFVGFVSGSGVGATVQLRVVMLVASQDDQFDGVGGYGGQVIQT